SDYDQNFSSRLHGANISRIGFLKLLDDSVLAGVQFHFTLARPLISRPQGYTLYDAGRRRELAARPGGICRRVIYPASPPTRDWCFRIVLFRLRRRRVARRHWRPPY